MITLRKARARVHIRRGDAHIWTSVPAEGFGELLELEDEFVPPESKVLTRTVAETVFYLCNGTLRDFAPTTQARGTLLAGAFQRVAGATMGVLSNPSSEEWARIVRIRLKPAGIAAEPQSDRIWFSASERRGRLHLVASSETDDGALWIPQDVMIYSSLLDPGQHVVCELEPAQCAWVHMVRGSADVLGEVLNASDSAEVQGVRAIGITAREESEVLVLVLPERQCSDPED